jgi:hypothetical protein
VKPFTADVEIGAVQSCDPVQTILRTLRSKGFVFATLLGELNRAGAIIGRFLRLAKPSDDQP